MFIMETLSIWLKTLYRSTAKTEDEARESARLAIMAPDHEEDLEWSFHGFEILDSLHPKKEGVVTKSFNDGVWIIEGYKNLVVINDDLSLVTCQRTINSALEHYGVMRSPE